MSDLFVLDGGGQTFFFAVIRLFGLLGGIAVGRSFADTWRSPALMPLALLLMAAAVQFVAYVVVGTDLMSLPLFVVMAVLVGLGGAYGFRAKRTEQMCRQYPWLFAKTGPVGWSHRA